jgi:hypothetical protein
MTGSIILLVLVLIVFRKAFRVARAADRGGNGMSARPTGIHPKDHRELTQLAKRLEGLYGPKKEKRQ